MATARIQTVHADLPDEWVVANDRVTNDRVDVPDPSLEGRPAAQEESPSPHPDARTTLTPTLVLKDGVAHLQAGAGIVADSVPALEHDECLKKLAALERAIELAEARL